MYEISMIYEEHFFERFVSINGFEALAERWGKSGQCNQYMAPAPYTGSAQGPESAGQTVRAPYQLHPHQRCV